MINVCLIFSDLKSTSYIFNKKFRYSFPMGHRTMQDLYNVLEPRDCQGKFKFNNHAPFEQFTFKNYEECKPRFPKTMFMYWEGRGDNTIIIVTTESLGTMCEVYLKTQD